MISETLLGLAVLLARISAKETAEAGLCWSETKYLIAFGDSWTYVQGTAGTANYSFIGSYLPAEYSFSPSTLLSNKIVQSFTGTSPGGPNWVQFLSGCGLEPGLTLPKECAVQLWDFGFAGADVSEEFLSLHHNFTTPLVNQTQQYLAYAEPVVGPAMQKEKALVAIWIGINDVNDAVKLHRDSTESLPDLFEDMVTAMFDESAQSMYEAGYRNFLFVNLPPLDRTTANQAKPEPSPSKQVIGWWNDALAAHVKAFSTSNSGTSALLYDANQFLNDVLDNAAEHGITNTTSFCPSYANLDAYLHPDEHGCSNFDEYFWFNSGHISSRVHHLLADDIRRVLQGGST